MEDTTSLWMWALKIPDFPMQETQEWPQKYHLEKLLWVVLFFLCKVLVLCKAGIFESASCSVFRSGLKLLLSSGLGSAQRQIKDWKFRIVRDLKGGKLRRAPGLGFKVWVNNPHSGTAVFRTRKENKNWVKLSPTQLKITNNHPGWTQNTPFNLHLIFTRCFEAGFG